MAMREDIEELQAEVNELRRIVRLLWLDTSDFVTSTRDERAELHQKMLEWENVGKQPPEG